VPDEARQPLTPLAEERPPLRFVTAAGLFDGHDASINIVRRLLQGQGAEVIHLGHNRSVSEVVDAAIQEDAQGIAISAYQGGHVEYFKYLVDELAARGAPHVRVFGGGGGTITRDEIDELEAHGVARIYRPEDGQRLGLKGMAADMMARAEAALDDVAASEPAPGDPADLPRLITAIERGALPETARAELARLADAAKAPVIGFTGTGGAGKSSLIDELIRRFRLDRDDLAIALLAVDPTKRKTGGALLGDRIRLNAIDGGRVFVRSLATRGSGREVADATAEAVRACRAAGMQLIFVETAGIGQGDAAIAGQVDLSLYVMTPEFGAASQLEKIDMLDLADIVAINKVDRRGAADALRDVRKQVQRSHERFGEAPEAMPVYGTVASRFNDDGVTALYRGILAMLHARGRGEWPSRLPHPDGKTSTPGAAVVPPGRVRYLAEIAEAVRGRHRRAQDQARLAREAQQLREARHMLEATGGNGAALAELEEERASALAPESRTLLEQWQALQQAYAGDEYVVKIRGKEVRYALAKRSLSGTRLPRVALPRFQDDGDRLRWLMLENVPGSYPYTAGVFAFKRDGERPTRMFAGEGPPARTNARFHALSRHAPAKRLSTAFDSVTLYGFDPDERPDIYGKVGNSGVSVATLEDMKTLYAGFDLCDPATSVSLTINGPAPAILAMFLNTAIDQQIEQFHADNRRPPSPEEAEKVREWALETVRGTVQADILKEDQGQNTCIFSTEFALKMMGDIQDYFIHHHVRNFYSVSISGYHIAEAGANPITQLAFTLANGFTYVEAYLARGMDIDEFAPNLSFFFSNGMDPEYAVLGRVARRIWAVAMRDRYGAGERSQKLKYHIQTSGRSLHAQEMDFNDVRTTLQALIAHYDHCNSLHTNAYDEAFTTPTDESVRRALAIQLIINEEWGLGQCENPNQGSFVIEELTDLVEEAVLEEFERLAERGGVLGAMETGYQRGKIQDESLHYETLKHTGQLPIIGVNTFLPPEGEGGGPEAPIALSRSTEAEKQEQIRRLRAFQEARAAEAPAMLARLKDTALAGGNVFAVLMDAVRVCSLGQITRALFEVGGRYRRTM
jgi:methylmalonyl-CoA mutase